MSSRSKSSPQVHQIKAIFEGFRQGHARPSGHHSRTSSYRSNVSTDKLVEQPDKTEASLISHSPEIDTADTIESVIDTPPLTRPRPALSAKPSWIGSLNQHQPIAHHSERIMARKVTITYAAPGLRAPVYITTSLSDPAWDIIEMAHVRTPHGDLLFHIDFDATEGEYQYKFRLGPGDWWVCDESKPTIEDGLGNRNNILHIEPEAHLHGLSKIDSARETGES